MKIIMKKMKKKMEYSYTWMMEMKVWNREMKVWNRERRGKKVTK